MGIIELNEIRKIQLKILDTIVEFCNGNGLEYFLAYGTLLGAVRHKGYIPWDDDIDLVMPRPDYEYLIANFITTHYSLLFFENDHNFPYAFIKVCDNRTLLIEQTDLQCPTLGVNIDIFPLDGLPSERKRQTKLFSLLKFKDNILNIKKISLSRSRGLHKNLILFLGKIAFFWINDFWINRSINVTAQKYTYQTSMEVGNLVSYYGIEEIFDKEIFLNKKKLEFEGKHYFVPGNFDIYLRTVYGDYMQLPPIEKRATHHRYEAFWREEDSD